MRKCFIVGGILCFLLLAGIMTGCGQAPQQIDYLVLVNQVNKLPETWPDALKGRLVSEKNMLGDEVVLEKETMKQILALREALAAEGVSIELDSGYRSVEAQQEIVLRFTEQYGADYVKQFVAPPGYSEHHTGLAIDVFLVKDGVPIVENEDMVKETEIWDRVHALLANYGFILRYPEGKESITGYDYEPWHFRYVGKKTAKAITDQAITLEEYRNLGCI